MAREARGTKGGSSVTEHIHSQGGTLKGREQDDRKIRHLKNQIEKLEHELAVRKLAMERGIRDYHHAEQVYEAEGAHQGETPRPPSPEPRTFATYGRPAIPTSHHRARRV